jgi:hypothetical protein
MSHIHSIRRKPAVAATFVLLSASLGLAACGGSSGSTTGTASTSKNASATVPGGSTPSGSSTTPGNPTHPGFSGPGAAHFQALRECLQKNGVTLPQRTPGQRPGGPAGAGGFLGAGHGPQLPKGMTRAQYEAVIKKCGGSAFANRGFRGTRLGNPAAKQALAVFADCMRSHGVNVPEPNTSGTGPIFDTKGIDTASSQFKAAETACASDLRGAFRAGGSGSPNPGGG